MPKLTDSKLVILSTAAKRADGIVLPLPKSLKIGGGAATSVLKSLIKKSLVEEKPAAADAAAWRENEDGRRVMLVITDAGMQAIGVEPGHGTGKRALASEAQPKKRRQRATRKAADPEQKAKTSPSAIRPGTKQALLVELLSRRKGATVTDLQKATGWLPHTVRASLTGLRKKGFTVASEKPEKGERFYRIPVSGNAQRSNVRR